MEYTLAKKIIKKMVASYTEQHELLCDIKDECSEEEFESFKRPFGLAMGHIITITDQIIKEYPDLTPPQWKDSKN